MKKLLILLLFLLWPVNGLCQTTLYIDTTNGTDQAGCGDTSDDNDECKSLEYAIEDIAGASPGSYIIIAEDNVTVLKAGTDGVINYNTIVPLTIQAANWSIGMTPTYTFVIPDAADNAYVLRRAGGEITIRGFDISWHATATADHFVYSNSNAAITFLMEDCKYDANESGVPGEAKRIFTVTPSNDSNVDVDIKRCWLEDTDDGVGLVRIEQDTDADVSVRYESCYGTLVGMLLNDVTGHVDTYQIVNCSFAESTTGSQSPIGIINASAALTIVNNIFTADNSNETLFRAPTWPLTTAAVIENNIWWSTDTIDASALYDMFVITDNELMTLSSTNYHLDPDPDADGIDEAPDSSSYIIGRGNESYLPTYDKDGTTWTGPHIGCYANTGVTTGYTPSKVSVTNGNIVFCGDSIAVGAANRISTTDATRQAYFNLDGTYTDAGGDVSANCAIGGRGIQTAFFLIDRIAEQYAPEFVFIVVGNNNCLGDGTTLPTSMDNADYATFYKAMMDKCYAWGMHPINLGLAPAQAVNGTPSHTEVHDALETAVENEIAGAYLSDSIQDEYITLNASNFEKCISDSGYYTDANCGAQCGGGGDCLAQNVHPGTAGYDIILDIAYRQFIKFIPSSIKNNLGLGM